jgi:hypothetical protein
MKQALKTVTIVPSVWEDLYAEALKEIDRLREQLAAFEAAEEREYIVICEGKFSYHRHPNVQAAIREGVRLTKLTGKVFTICKVKGSIAAPEPCESRQPDLIGE